MSDDAGQPAGSTGGKVIVIVLGVLIFAIAIGYYIFAAYFVADHKDMSQFGRPDPEPAETP